jgi:hypothetical protein
MQFICLSFIKIKVAISLLKEYLHMSQIVLSQVANRLRKFPLEMFIVIEVANILTINITLFPSLKVCLAQQELLR